MFFSEEREPMRVAVISAHPDDETLGAGGTLAKHAACGDEIHACIVTQGYAPDWPEDELEAIHEQAIKALETLGIKDASFLGFPTVKLNSVPGKDLNDRVAEFIDGFDPEVVYAPFPGDLNSDHGIVARAAAVAVRPTGEKKRSLLYFETLSSTEWGRLFLRTCFMPNLYFDISSTIETKIKGASIFESEMKRFPHPRSLESIRTLAKQRGMEVGLEAAEAFMLALHIS